MLSFFLSSDATSVDSALGESKSGGFFVCLLLFLCIYIRKNCITVALGYQAKENRKKVL